MAEPGISVIVVCRDAHDTIARCMDQLLGQQDFWDFEVVVVDDGSTDDTWQILQRYVKDMHVRLFHMEHAGIAAARNRGVKEACSRYVTFVDADDIVAPTYLSTLFDAMGYAFNRLVVSGIASVPMARASTFADWVACDQAAVVDPHEAARLTLINVLSTSACCKLAPRTHFLEHPFSGSTYEELRAIGPLLASVDEVCVASATIYGYVVRPDSTVRKHDVSFEQISSYIDAIATARESFAENFEGLDDEVGYFSALMYTRAHDLLDTADKSSYMYDLLEKLVHRRVQKSCKAVRRVRGVRAAKKARILLYAFDPKRYAPLMQQVNQVRNEQ